MTAIIPHEPLAAVRGTIEKLQFVADELKGFFLERDEIIDCMLVALLARAHTIMIGPPGTGKSYLIEALRSHLEGFTMFGWQVTKFSTPEELFGPYSLPKLKEGKYVRETTGKLPESHLVYLDEVFNANSSILNALNSIMNERTFEGNACPLQSLYGATNLIPEEKALVAFFDRFLFRLIVDYVHDSSAFTQLLGLGEYAARTILPAGEIEELQRSISTVDISRISPRLVKLWGTLRAEGISISDRRWMWSLRALRARALSQGRGFCTDDDMFILRHVLWTDPKEIPLIEQKVLQAIDPASARVKEIMDMAMEIKKGVDALDASDSKEAFTQIMEAAAKLKDLSDEIDAVSRRATTSDRVRGYAGKLGNQLQATRANLINDKLGKFGL